MYPQRCCQTKKDVCHHHCQGRCRKKCKEKSYCSFNMGEEGIVAKSSDCSKGTWLLVRYTCKFSDIKKCLFNSCNANANCTDIDGSFKCQCKEGYSGNGINCTNIDECLSHPCDDNANCTDNDGSFECQCKEGYSGNGTYCTNVNECLFSPCDDNANCTDNEGSFECRCKEGFFRNGTNCTNIDECLSHPCDDNANCTDNDGSFECQCKEGYSGNGTYCTNVNECLLSPCDDNANCTDNEGSFECRCNEGFFRNGANCTNIDECLSHPCDDNANCTDNDGSFECQCKEGYSGNGTYCTNVNECLLSPCDDNANCTDNEGSFECRCKEGFFRNGANCTNIDECLSHPCDDNANCTDNDGSFECQCKEGYSGNGAYCTNVNECLLSPCDDNANCTDNEGSFECRCKEGFFRNGANCTNIDECLSHPCDDNANCTDIDGSFECQCKEGYSGNGTYCTNVNECLLSPCDDNANCTDNEGSFECRCKEGFFRNGANCTNIDECLSHPCDDNANCTDNDGSFECQCKEGYSGNGTYCTSINECLFSPCDDNANCTDNEGSFECRCKEGFSGDGFSCTNILSSIQMNLKYEGISGKLLIITCTVDGSSSPNFLWKNGSLVLSHSSNVKMETKDKVSKLFVRNTTPFDSGVYHCIARKDAASIASNISVKVKNVPVISVFPLSISATEGDVILLTCLVDNNQYHKVEVLWFNSSTPTQHIDTGRELNLTNRIQLKTRNRYEETYWCNATNQDGTSRSQNVSVVVVSKEYKDYCSAEKARGYDWKRTPVGSNVVKKCRDKKIGVAFRLCSKDNGRAAWDKVDVSNCRSPIVVDLVEQVSRLEEGFASINVSEILKRTEVVTKDGGELFEQDIRDIVSVLKRTQTKTSLPTDREKFIRSSSNIVGSSKRGAWKNLQERNTLAKHVIEGSDMNAKKLVAETGKPGRVLKFKTENIELLGIKLHKNKPAQPEDVNLMSEDEGVEFLWVDGIKQATVVKYTSIKDILSPEELQNLSTARYRPVAI
ncbi:neurogenic locus notch homolog protein 1-like isoform X3 [Xenia sp. Carnegie-2017]|uniref:neurogenic locus notch homolog protein 1-like isoform X3 n=1 Tax=Xenia sp. Carnegie-2017 TaxID=2897299 RepID=UPI001F048D81|nr:neurogenic locus notch homolog protein 1-like isoform X3 [Xenia sp. Carnegie-2017]